jgi:pyruvate dehydrogenase (quinone)
MVLHNNDLNQVTWEQRAMAGEPRLAASQALPDFDYAAYADLCGWRGLRMIEPGDIGRVWDEAIKSDRPVLIDALADPEVPPLPPHIEFKQAKSIMSALIKGDPHATEIIANSFKGEWAKLAPGK